MKAYLCTFCGDHYDPKDPMYDSLDEWRADHEYEDEGIQIEDPS